VDAGSRLRISQVSVADTKGTRPGAYHGGIDGNFQVSAATDVCWLFQRLVLPQEVTVLKQYPLRISGTTKQNQI